MAKVLMFLVVETLVLKLTEKLVFLLTYVNVSF